jgi:hypothetical protein
MMKVERYKLLSLYTFFDNMPSFHLSNEKNFSVIFFSLSTFCSTSITTSLDSDLTLNDFSTVRKRLDFLPSSVISILSTISNFSISNKPFDLSVSRSMRNVSFFYNLIT